uniref:tetraacyldisaccharide 4'-kinase n=1 Tax=Ningiella ruwaisensis TaxID=2364274 RepID=UPI00109F52FB|nr:tetraacyldisaccharide 4'-kinase [Ningiella ruwaisensis]
MLSQAWYSDLRHVKNWWLVLLWPLALVFFLLSILRRLAYQFGILKVYRPQLPVVVVGNISVGGNGKTPVVLALASHFISQGVKCAVLSRGYGGTQKAFPHLLDTCSSPKQVGDEPALIFKRLGVDVVIDPVRARGAQFIEANTQAQVILCDDGMQHYALARDVEICVVDGRGLGNGFVMPMGPLRETRSRLNDVDIIISNRSQKLDDQAKPGRQITGDSDIKSARATRCFDMQLRPASWINVKSGQSLAVNEGVERFLHQEVIALAGIGAPQRFFNTLRELGLTPKQSLRFDDHHKFVQSDIPQAPIVLMTEKDAIKCSEFANDNWWYLAVDADISNEFFDSVMQKLHLKIDNDSED